MQLLSILYVLQISFASLKLKDTSHADVKGKFPRQTVIQKKIQEIVGFQREKKKKKACSFFSQMKAFPQSTVAKLRFTYFLTEKIIFISHKKKGFRPS